MSCGLDLCKFYVGDAILCIKTRHFKSLPLSQKLSPNCKQRGKNPSPKIKFSCVEFWLELRTPNIYASTRNNVILKIKHHQSCVSLKNTHQWRQILRHFNQSENLYYTYFILAPPRLAEEYSFHSPYLFTIWAGSFVQDLVSKTWMEIC